MQCILDTHAHKTEKCLDITDDKFQKLALGLAVHTLLEIDRHFPDLLLLVTLVEF